MFLTIQKKVSEFQTSSDFRHLLELKITSNYIGDSEINFTFSFSPLNDFDQYSGIPKSELVWILDVRLSFGCKIVRLIDLNLLERSDF